MSRGLPLPLSFPAPPLLALALLTPVLLVSCSDAGPAGPDLDGLEVLLVQGDGQAGKAGTTLQEPLQVRVQTRGNGTPLEGIKIRWEILEGDGAELTPSVSITDSLGLTSTRLTLGPNVGPYRIGARLKGAEEPSLHLRAEAVARPVIIQAPPGPVRPGDTLYLGGASFSPEAEKNVVTFSRIRGPVLEAAPHELRVQVPSCLPAREIELRVQVGSVASEPVALEVAGSPSPLLLTPGEDRVLDQADGMGCFYLPSAFGSLYLVVPSSTATVGGAQHPINLLALTPDGADPWSGVANGGPTPDQAIPPVYPDPASFLAGRAASMTAQHQWDEHLRLLERGLLGKGGGGGAGSREVPVPAGAGNELPRVGDRRVFKVLNRKDRFDRVKARVRYISDHALVYLDEDAPPGGFDDRDLEALALEFEEPIRRVVTETFGAESDVDGNGRVIILFTPAVNRLSEEDAEGFVGGYFYGLDLLTGRTGSNGGEIFYSVVPDPAGEEGPVIGRYTALTTVPAILAHEFEHMVHFHQRMMVEGADSQDALWLSEALAQMAEDLVAQAFEETYRPVKAAQYRSGNRIRAQRFLRNTRQVSVLASLPPGTLAERGAGWLFLKHVSGREGQDGLLKRLVSSRLSGTASVTKVSGLAWDDLVTSWAGSLFLDGTGLPVRPELRMAGVDLSSFLADFGGAYPLQPEDFGARSSHVEILLRSSAPAYYIIHPPEGGVALGVAGPGGGTPDAALGLRTLVVRLQ